jgi:predicted translin family RNA/ssDNA-binding protein
MSDTEIRMMRYTIEQLSAELHATRQYVYELESKLDRTHKALNKAKNGLKELKDIIACPPDISYETCVSMYADGVLQEITTLEQKE